MKRLSIILLLICLVLQIGLAAPRSYRQAKAIAQSKAMQLGIKGADIAYGKQVIGGEEKDGKAYYAFNNGSDKGFTVVSGDDRLPEVIGYATKGSFAEDDMPAQLKWLLDAYERQFEALVKNDAKAMAAMEERESLAVSRTVANTTVSPLLGDIAWNQEAPFNNLCPWEGSNRSVTGCVATAMAQVIAYNKYPTTLQAAIPAYTTSSKEFTMPEISAGASYDYENMLAQYTDDSYTEAQANAVATLMLHCGCSVKMDYSYSEGSGAVTSYAMYALGTYFGYDKDLLAWVPRSNYTLENWCSLLDNELKSTRPVIFSGQSLKEGGHAFVCDGADGAGFYHINWGWGGYCNGYFDVSLLNNYEAETSTGADGFNYGLAMIIGIAPDNETTDAPLVETHALQAQVKSFEFTSSSRADVSGSFSGNATVTVLNPKYHQFDGWVALATESGSSYTLISKKANISLKASEGNGYYYCMPTLSFNAALPVGMSKICMVYGTGDAAPKPCGNYKNKAYFFIDATETTASYVANGYKLSATLTAPSTIYNGMDNKLALSVKNTGVEELLDLINIYTSSTAEKPTKATSNMLLTVPVGETTQRNITINPATTGDYYVWIDASDGTPLVTAQKFAVEISTEPVLTLVSVETNAEAEVYETVSAAISYQGNLYRVQAPKTYADKATFTFNVQNTGGATDCSFLLTCYGFDKEIKDRPLKRITSPKRIETGKTVAFTMEVSPNEINSQFPICAIEPLNGIVLNLSESLSIQLFPILADDGTVTSESFYLGKNMKAIYIAPSITTCEGKGSSYWATFSNWDHDVEFKPASGQSLTLYNVKVSGGKMTLTPRTGELATKAAKGEAVLIKTDAPTLKYDCLGTQALTAAGDNDLVATPKDAGVIKADTGYTLYRLTYNKVQTKEGLGFYLGVVGESKDGSQLKATPGKGYLKVSTQAATKPSAAAPARGFAFPGDDGETTGIECITVTDESTGNNRVEGIFDLQGRKVSKPTKGVYINNGKKVVIN